MQRSIKSKAGRQNLREGQYSREETLTYKANAMVTRLARSYGPDVIRLCINHVLGLNEAAMNDWESIPACEFLVQSNVYALRRMGYKDSEIAAAFNEACDSVLEESTVKKGKRVTEMGRLSTIHSGGADKRAAGVERRNAAISKRNNTLTEEELVALFDKILDQFASAQYSYVKVFCEEVNEDAQNKITAVVENANEQMLKNGIRKVVDIFDQAGASFHAYWGFGEPSIYAGKAISLNGTLGLMDPDTVYYKKEACEAINACIARGEPVYLFYPARDPKQFFEFENYEPICRPGIWDKTFDIKSRKGAGAILIGGSSKVGTPKGFPIAVINSKNDFHIITPEENEASALVTTDDLFDCLDQDEVFANWLMTSEYDPMYDEESGEYLESVKVRRRINNSITEFAPQGNTGMFDAYQKANHKKVYEGFYTDEEREARGIHPQDGGGICNICGEDVAGGEFYADDLDSTREIILEYLCEEFGMRWDYSAEYEVQRMFGWDDDTWEESIEEIYSYLPDGSDYLCHDCMHQACKEAVHKWHLDYFDDVEESVKSKKGKKAVKEAAVIPGGVNVNIENYEVFGGNEISDGIEDVVNYICEMLNSDAYDLKVGYSEGSISLSGLSVAQLQDLTEVLYNDVMGPVDLSRSKLLVYTR